MPADADRDARFAAFVAPHRDRAIGLAWRLLAGDGAAAEDVAQEAFVRAYRGSRAFAARRALDLVLPDPRERGAAPSALALVRERRRASCPRTRPIRTRADAGDPALRGRVARRSRLPRGQREAFVLVHLEGLA